MLVRGREETGAVSSDEWKRAYSESMKQVWLQRKAQPYQAKSEVCISRDTIASIIISGYINKSSIYLYEYKGQKGH